MAKSKSIKSCPLLVVISVVLAVVSLSLFFVPFVDTTYGYQVAFGYTAFSQVILGVEVTVKYNLAPLTLIAAILLLVNVVLGLLTLLINGKVSKYILFCLALIGVVATVFLFLSKTNFVAANPDYLSNDTSTLATGAILSGVYAGLSSLGFLASAFFKK